MTSTWQERRGTTLTLRDTVTLATIIEACQHNAFVRWQPAKAGGLLLEGTLRCVGDENGCALRADEDVRDAYVRITTTGGMEVFMPIVEAVNLHRSGLFAIGDRR